MRVRLFLSVLMVLMGAGHAAADDAIELSGGGPGFPFPLMEKLTGEYAKLHPDVRIINRLIPVRGEITLLWGKHAEFVASDIAWTDNLLKRLQTKSPLEI